MIKYIKLSLFIGTGVMISLCTATSFAQQNVTITGSNTVASDVNNNSTSVDLDTQWLWGEVVAVNTEDGKSITVKYLDYETDSEKEVKMIVDDKTSFENNKTISDIKVQDTVSVDYVTNAEGKNFARNINVEKPEVMQAPAEMGMGEGAEATSNAVVPAEGNQGQPNAYVPMPSGMEPTSMNAVPDMGANAP